MVMAQGSLQGKTVRRSAWRAGISVPAAMFTKTALTVGRLIVGSGGYRNYPRERFSDYELHQLVAGRKDRLDGLG
jgi:hypothetical protein